MDFMGLSPRSGGRQLLCAAVCVIVEHSLETITKLRPFPRPVVRPTTLMGEAVSPSFQALEPGCEAHDRVPDTRPGLPCGPGQSPPHIVLQRAM
jgi:hypothetical protein